MEGQEDYGRAMRSLDPPSPLGASEGHSRMGEYEKVEKFIKAY